MWRHPRRIPHGNCGLLSFCIRNLFDPLISVRNRRSVVGRGRHQRRRYVVPSDVPVCVFSGRWGPRRARVGQCVAILAAELVYGNLVCQAHSFGPGWRAALTWSPHGTKGPAWKCRAEVVANAVWRRGRLFFRCNQCGRRATRLYVPVMNLEPRCRRCWGLAYESQSWSYKPTGWLGRILGPVAHATTLVRRRERRLAAHKRYAARRPFL
jgi:hypothetical protein